MAKTKSPIGHIHVFRSTKKLFLQAIRVVFLACICLCLLLLIGCCLFVVFVFVVLLLLLLLLFVLLFVVVLVFVFVQPIILAFVVAAAHL